MVGRVFKRWMCYEEFGGRSSFIPPLASDDMFLRRDPSQEILEIEPFSMIMRMLLVVEMSGMAKFVNGHTIGAVFGRGTASVYISQV